MRTFVIAEAGANHDRNFEQALHLIDTAKLAGASAIKFQTYSSETLYAKNTPDFAGYKNINALIKSIELPREWQKDLKAYADSQEIEFMSTPFDEAAVEELVQIGVKRLKISGFESTDLRFVDMVASTGLPLVISMGIGFKRGHLEKILTITQRYGNTLTLLHCNNAYPTPMEDIGLDTLRNLIREYPSLDIGLSDHTTSILTPSLAVATGAVAIEKHFTLNRTFTGPDHSFALEFEELKQMIQLIKETELAFTPQTNEYTESEKSFVQARRSIVTKRKIKKNEYLSVENITTKRPYSLEAISASQYFTILGAQVNKEIDEDSPLNLKDIYFVDNDD